MERDKLIVEYTRLCLEFQSFTGPDPVDKEREDQVITRIYEIRELLGMKPIALKQIAKLREASIPESERIFNIGFINTEGQEDETQFTARGVCDLEAVWIGFCRENHVDINLITYVEILHEEDIKE